MQRVFFVGVVIPCCTMSYQEIKEKPAGVGQIAPLRLNALAHHVGCPRPLLRAAR